MLTHKDYREPEAILSDPRLTPDRQRQILKDWQCDLRQRLRAGSENMLGLPGTAPDEADLFRRVHLCLSKVPDAAPAEQG